MTLSEWLERAPVAMLRPGAIPDALPDDMRRQLWRLEDYVVSSVAAGTIWLVPRPSCPSCSGSGLVESESGDSLVTIACPDCQD
jgi:hypothetical protein